MAAAWRRPSAWACAAVVLLGACTYSDREAGLFDTRPPSTRSSSPVERRIPSPPAPTNPDLPVAGERVWVSAASRFAVTVRIAVHAVRRVEGATVLDWSITPVRAAGFGPGDSLPSIDFGLEPPGRRAPGLVLLVPGAGRAYQPLVHREWAEFHHCLCTPLWVLAQDLRLGETRLLQAAFPPLPAGLTAVDVDLLTVAPIRGVPVTPVGSVPTVTAPTDLARAADAPAPAPASAAVTFANPARSEQLQQIQAVRVLSAPGGSTLEWTLTTLDDQQSRVLDYGPPVTAPGPRRLDLANANPASGPVLRAGGTRLRNLWVRTTRNDRTAYECQCTEISLWSSGLRGAGVGAGLVTSYPTLPAGTRTVDVELPGSGVLRRVPVVAAEDAAARLGAPTTAETGRWTYATDDPPRGWPTAEWPTDTPDPEQLAAYEARVEPVLPLPASP